MPKIADRRIHAVLSDGQEIVRYDRAGHWYLESTDSRLLLKFAQAVFLAQAPDTVVNVGVPGGSRFDAAVARVKNPVHSGGR